MPPEQDPTGAGGAAGGDKDAVVKKLQEDLAKLSEASGKRDAEYQALKETYERTNALLQSMMENPDRGGKGNGQPAGGGARGGEIDLSDINFDELGIPKQAAEVLIQRTLKVAEQRLDQRVVGLTQMAQQREAFYKKNPDLVGHEFLVGSISQQVQAENPTMTLDKSFELVATKTRAYIKGLQDSRGGGAGSEVPPIAGGGGSRDGHPAGGAGGETPPEETTPDQDIQSEIAARNKIRGRGMNRARSV